MKPITMTADELEKLFNNWLDEKLKKHYDLYLVVQGKYTEMVFLDPHKGNRRQLKINVDNESFDRSIKNIMRPSNEKENNNFKGSR